MTNLPSYKHLLKMGNKSSKMIEEDDLTKDSIDKISNMSNVSNEDPDPNITPKKTGVLGSKVPEFESNVYLPKIDAIEIMNQDEMEGAFTVLYFFPGDFGPGVLPEVSELKKSLTSSSSESPTTSLNLLCVSTDSIDAHKAFSQMEQSQGGLKGLDIVLVSDQTGELCKLFQVYDESTHSAYPSYIILDTELKVVLKTTFDPKVGGDAQYVVNALKYLMNEESAQKDDKKPDFKANKEVTFEVDKVQTDIGKGETSTKSERSV